MVLYLFDKLPTGQLLTRQLPAVAIVSHSTSATLSCCQCAVVGIEALPVKLPAARHAAWETERWTTCAQPPECLVTGPVCLHLWCQHDQSSSAAAEC